MCQTAIIMPDSFKGSMRSSEVAAILRDEITRQTTLQPLCFPIADGGEGSVDCILSILGGTTQKLTVKSPEWKDIDAYYGITTDGQAIIEFAQSSGLTRQTSYQACKATSFGFGQLILHALDQGIRNFLLCLGGSATTDGACGMIAALGAVFTDSCGNSFIPVGDTLAKIASLDLSKVDPRIRESSFVVMCDVENPLYGSNGAAYIYAGQKGATPTEKILLDDGLRHLCHMLKGTLGIDYSDLKGGGAAGGAGCGCVAFLNATLRSGIDVMLDLCHFDEALTDCALIVTGEGRLDQQSLMGKVLSGIRRRSGTLPIVSFCGSCELSAENLAAHHITAVEIGRGIPLEEAIRNGKKYLQCKAKDFDFSSL